MKYFFIVLFFIVFLVLMILGYRGRSFGNPPLEIFSDMDRQNVVKYQQKSDFFLDGMASRKHIKNTFPQKVGNFKVNDFGNEALTGMRNGKFINSYPKEIRDKLSERFLNLGREKYDIHCGICHGANGDGKGILNNYVGLQNIIANIRDKSGGIHDRALGDIYNTINKGKGSMGAYGGSLDINERWAVVSYVKYLQKIGRAHV